MLKNPVRIVTAASLFDGHDASINIIRRLLQEFGAEVIHLGHNRSVADVVKTALQEGRKESASAPIRADTWNILSTCVIC